ncbi:MAG TPA: FAD/NAD(P)-binding oxidoreductase [Verrucomicrobiae bacterium]
MTSERHTCEVLVVGAGPAGITAACVAGEAGKSVALVDNSPWLGGQIWRGEQTRQTHQEARRWLRRLENCGARIFSGATVFDGSATGTLFAESPTAILEFTWRKLIVATGAREVLLPFPGWTLPGVMGAGGLHAMVQGGWPVAGKRVVVAGSGPLLLAVAQGLQEHGADVPLVVEQAPWSKVIEFGAGLLRFPTKLLQGIATRAALGQVRYRCGCWPVRAEGAEWVQSVVLTNGKSTWTERYDYLAWGFHLVPNLELPLLLGCVTANGSVAVDAFQETSVKAIYCAGEPTGVGGADSALVEGQIAGLAAAGKTEEARALFRRRNSWHRFKAALSTAFALRPELKRLAAADTIVCRCEDVRQAELAGFADWRAAKLQTRCGMGPCQGRVCGAATHVLFGWELASVRPPIFPVRTGTLRAAGTCLKPQNEDK